MRRFWWLCLPLALILWGCGGFVVYDELVWSPDGNALAYRNNNAVAISDAAGNHERTIRPGSLTDHPAWLPDGRLAYVETTREGAGGQVSLFSEALYLYDPKSKQSTLVAGGLAPVFGLAWHPVEGNQALVRMNSQPDLTGGIIRLFLLELGTGSLKPIEGIADSSVTGAQWVGGGNRIAYTQAGVLFTRDLQSGATAACPCRGDVTDFAVSPAGRWIIYRAGAKGDTRMRVYIIAADFTGESVRLAETDMAHMAISPDGRRMAYTRVLSAGRSVLHFFDLPQKYWP